MKQQVIIVIILFLLGLPLMLPLFRSGYFPTHDGEWAIVRLAEMTRELKDLQFPPQWAQYLNHGYGYPLFLFTYPLPYYIGAFFHIVGLGLTESIKAVFLLSIIGSGATMYLFISSLWGRDAGLLSSVLYLYAPYRLVNLYIRGSIGESLAFVFFPLLMYLLTRLLETKLMKYLLGFSLSLALFLLTHNAMVVLFLPFLLCWGLWCMYCLKSKERKQALVRLGLGFALGLLLGASFWLPAIVDKRFIRLNVVPLAQKADNFVSLSQLISYQWIFDTHPPLTIGIIHLGIAICAIFFMLRNFKDNKSERVLSILAIISILLLFSFSYPIWQLPLLREIDFPWRMLAVASFFVALLGGVLARGHTSWLILIILGCITIASNARFIQTQEPFIHGDDYYATNDATTTSAAELMPIWVRSDPTQRPSAKVINPLITIENSREKSNRLELALTNTTSTEQPMIVHTLYFPNWEAFLDGAKIAITPDVESGNITLTVPPKTHTLVLSFVPRLIQNIANIMSLGGIGICTALWLLRKKLQ